MRTQDQTLFTPSQGRFERKEEAARLGCSGDEVDGGGERKGQPQVLHPLTRPPGPWGEGRVTASQPVDTSLPHKTLCMWV